MKQQNYSTARQDGGVRVTPVRLRRSLRRAGVLVAAACLALAGCGGQTDNPAPKGAKAEQKAAPDRVEPLSGTPKPQLPVTVTSADGKKVTVESADRIVPLTGSINEIVFTLGLGESVVAKDITATFEQAGKLPTVTRGHDVSAESVLSLKPTVVIGDTTSGPAESMQQIRDAGIPVVLLDTAKSLEDVSKRIGEVAEVLGVEKAGDELIKRTEDRITAVQKDIPRQEKKPRVAFLYLRGTAAVYLIGGAESGAGSLLDAAGAVDAGAESGLEKDFTAITPEALAKAQPDVILVMTKGLESVGGIDGLVKIPGVAETPAGMDRRVVDIPDGVLLNYGPRTDEVLKSLVDQLYEDAK
ncbi:heme/hemin ABC transporter substrate-binding protein [Streptomyces mesophilus]|uniref:heme/hemin ABC transporter substrate-binding protein n=1 Tax=Streptomyces mesophilus TaxID=1775132 RepID=UPI003EC019BF